MSHPLSHSDLLRIIEEYLTSDLTKYATEKKYGLYQGCITYWLRTLGLYDKPKNEDIMVKQPTTSIPETPLSPSEKDELQTLRREIRELKAPLMHYLRSLLITGGAGFIGSHVVRLLANKYPQYHIVCLDKLTYAGNLKTLEDVAGLPNYTFVEADICELGWEPSHQFEKDLEKTVKGYLEHRDWIDHVSQCVG